MFTWRSSWPAWPRSRFMWPNSFHVHIFARAGSALVYNICLLRMFMQTCWLSLLSLVWHQMISKPQSRRQMEATWTLCKWRMSPRWKYKWQSKWTNNFRSPWHGWVWCTSTNLVIQLKLLKQLKLQKKGKLLTKSHSLSTIRQKHREKTPSATQCDKLVLNEARDYTFCKNLAEATRQSTKSFSNALKDVSHSIVQIGNGISCSMEMMLQAIMAQVMANSQPRPFNQNHCYEHGEMSHLQSSAK